MSALGDDGEDPFAGEAAERTEFGVGAHGAVVWRVWLRCRRG